MIYYVYNSVFNTYDLWKKTNETHKLIETFESEDEILKKYPNADKVREMTRCEWLQFLASLQEEE